ncbi:MAG TPA: UDP-2,3-diacylglucosamine diphosphatase [Planctomycetota bacterium]|nr:UDP-2,3-diacylglucosamine diphosphatase [Planctomycetota bacterium]
MLKLSDECPPSMNDAAPSPSASNASGSVFVPPDWPELLPPDRLPAAKKGERWVVFAADMHLDPHKPERTAQFAAFMDRLAQARRAGAAVEFHLVGDFLEIWSESHRKHLEKHAAELAALDVAHQAGVGIHIYHGNRDFTYGDYLVKRVGAVIHPDALVVKLGAKSAHVSHGDLFCTQDVGYQRFRKWVRSKPVKLAHRTMPYFLWQRTVGKMRAGSKKHINETAQKGAGKMDLQPEALSEVFAAGHDLIICGHVHRPGVLGIEWKPGQVAPVYVVGDWIKGPMVVLWRGAAKA